MARHRHKKRTPGRGGRTNGNGRRPANGTAVILARRRRARQRHPVVNTLLRIAAVLGMTLALLAFVGAGVAAAAGYLGWSALTADLPSPDRFEALEFQTTKIYDRNWVLLSEVTDPATGWRTAISYEELMDHIRQQRNDPNKPHRAWIVDATIAAEDQTFWTNPGVEPRAILRSLIFNLSGESTSGASTITQQLVRMLYPETIGTERTYRRKIREAIMAIRFTQRYSKQEILMMYLNNVYYGNRAYGIDAAAQAYFNKFAWELSLAEASMLAGLPQAPSVYDPTKNFELAKARQRYVLDRMVELGMITRAEADQAFAEPLYPQSREGRYNKAPHFVNFVLDYLETKYGPAAVYRGGLMVRTTLDLSAQQAAEEIVKRRVQQLAPYRVDNGALVAMLPWSGEIIAMVGSADFYDDTIDGQFNVTTAERQPGSAIKPITYLAAFEKAGWYPGTVVFDYAKVWNIPGFGRYEPKNATGQHFGAITVREALANSLNIPALQAIEVVGVPAMIDMAHRLGIKTGFWRDPSYYGLSITLGGGEVSLLELTNAYATIANNGKYVPYNPILEIIAPGNNRIYQLDRARTLEQAPQVVRPEYAYLITDILSDNKARAIIFGLNNPLVLPELDNRPVAAKTGTSEDARDLWTVGYTTDIVVGVWVGRTDNQPTRGLDGISSAALIWHDFMVKIHQHPQLAKTLLGPDGQPIPVEFQRPPGIVEVQVCAATGKRPIRGARTVTELSVRDGPPRLRCNQASEYELRELRAALATPKGMTGRGLSSLQAYAAMVGVGPRIEILQPTPTPVTGESNSPAEGTGTPSFYPTSPGPGSSPPAPAPPTLPGKPPSSANP
ncbi:transglycosylase domain-containing protein [Thermomicrobium sp. CFH 73360]|uniref:transglycosylase domain-containing protein n=1 Tax=Thermomicrobium sp. CFH 73360 TaxID=2951987 RepID=UPI0020767DCA|nr:transglycosylase domain-containing protein [Thermomicrobium sp. CFH 73360]MCM8745394.1 transglycosylase domain-containing protein [Thermomicrobium sp. CFH 73360]